MLKYFSAPLFLSFLFTFDSNAQSLTAHAWRGEMLFYGQHLLVQARFTEANDSLKGIFISPTQSDDEIQLDEISRKGDSVFFRLPAGLPARFYGRLKNDSIRGYFKQGNVRGNFFLAKDDSVKKNPELANLPYTDEEISFTNGKEVFAGTLSIPKKGKKHPAVIFISGSGAQNRDENVAGFKIFKVLADSFARRGFVVLRYDDRNTGKSKGTPVSQSTTADFAEDVGEAIIFLRTRNEVDIKKIGLLGHSEGCLVATMVAAQNADLKFIILLSGPSVPGHEIITRQTQLILAANGTPQINIDDALNVQNYMFHVIATGSGEDTLENMVLDKAKQDFANMPPAQKKLIEDSDQVIHAQMVNAMAPVHSVWYKYFLHCDPAIYLSKVHCAVFATFGEKDLQVDAAQNLPPMKALLKQAGNKHFSYKIFPEANHLYQKAWTGNPSEYGLLKKEFIPGFVNELTRWAKKQK